MTSAIEDGWTKLRPFTRKLRGFRMTSGSDPFDHKQSAGLRSYTDSAATRGPTNHAVLGRNICNVAAAVRAAASRRTPS
jgi:hypothetical protein